ncbi:MAG: 2-oxoglutarate and iron-dependent oxygenase domain-containing protein [Pseudomonadota bacterium]
MAAIRADHTTETSLPIVDIAGLRSGDAADRQRVGQAIRKACLDKGFMYVVGHGVPATLQDAVFEESARFFAAADEVKAAVDTSHSTCYRGYEALRAQTLEAGTPPDLKEGFLIGRDLPLNHPMVLAGKFNHGPNQWPDGMPTFQSTMERYFAEMLGVGGVLMRGLALSLELDERAFDDYLHEPVAILRLLHYPPQPANPLPNEKGCGAHTDWGAVTLLMQDDVGGLEVWDRDKGWVPAPPIAGAYIVNIGDMVARLTNDRYHSTQHRVINATGRQRYSVPFFFEGNADVPVECLPNCLAPGEGPRYAPTTVEGHLREMYERTYAEA